MRKDRRLALVGDIGGTHARFAVADFDKLTISRIVTLRGDDFESLEAALQAYLNSIPDRPTVASLAIAGPIGPDPLRLTNRSWSFSRESIRSTAGVKRLLVINDFEAIALALPHLGSDSLHRLCGDEPVEGATKVVVGPGTGLGVSALVRSPSGWVALSTEGGHVSFSVQNARELAITDRMREGDGHVSAERLISGPGLARLHQVLGAIEGRKTRPLTAPEVISRATSMSDSLAAEALGLFVEWLARFAGDMALAHGARGGLYLGGGIAPKIIDRLDTDTFRKAFTSKGRLTPFLERIPVNVIRADDAGLRGAAVALKAITATA